MNTRDVVKEVGGLAVGAGVGLIMGGAVGMVAPIAGVGLLTKAAISIGGVTLGSMVEDKTYEYFQEKVDQVCDMLKIKKSEKEEEED